MRSTTGQPGKRALNREAIERLDAEDPLAAYRERFEISDPSLVYLDGNSLGRPPRATAERLHSLVTTEWGDRLIRSWDEGWMERGAQVGDLIGSAALGAAPGQTLVADSTTVCLYKLAHAALHARPGRNEIVTDVGNFPTDRYVFEGIAARHGAKVRWLESDPVAGPSPEEVAAAVDERTALVSFSHVGYYSASIADMGAINDIVHAAGALTLWDLSHSAGSIPVELDRTDTDLAVGCTYKYLNGGPGAPAYLYVRSELQGLLSQPIWGWLGRRDPFLMEPRYVASSGISSFVSGTPPILGICAVEEGVKLLAEAGIEPVRAKGIALTEIGIELFDKCLEPLGFELVSPRDSRIRGAHITLQHAEAQKLCRELIADGVIPDFRVPDAIRLGMSPLTTRFSDVWRGIARLAELAER